MKNPASKVAKLAQIRPKSQFLFHKNLPLWDFSIKPNIIYCMYFNKLNLLEVDKHSSCVHALMAAHIGQAALCAE